MQQRFGWDGYFATLTGSCIAAIVLLLPLINAKSQNQIAAEAAAAGKGGSQETK
jgi:sugar phosphate permease